MNNHLSVIDLRFKEFEELNEAVQGWNIDFRPLSQGDHFSELQQIVTPQLTFTRAHFNNIVDQRGSSAKGFRTFSILADMSRDTFWCHQSIGQHELIIFPVSGEFTAISQTNFNVYAFDIDEQLLIDMTAALYHQDWFSLVNNESRVINCEPTDIEALRLLLKMLSQQGKNFCNTTTSEASWAKLHFEENLVEQLLKCILGNDNKPNKNHPSKKALALSRAIEYIETAPQDSITATQLSKVSGASQRTLEYAFKAHFGLAPKAYIKCARLHAAHKMLYHAKGTHQQINEIANQQGFWHMGQFAADYKKLYGELPSETYRYRS